MEESESICGIIVECLPEGRSIVGHVSSRVLEEVVGHGVSHQVAQLCIAVNKPSLMNDNAQRHRFSTNTKTVAPSSLTVPDSQMEF